MTEPTKNTSPSKKLSIYRAICAALVFNVYSLFLCSAFQKNTPYLFEQHRSDGFPAPHIDLASASWGKHYLWRLIAAVVVTIFVGLLAGAFARIRGKRIAALSNIPSVLFWCWLLYVLWSGKYEIDEQFAFEIVAVIAIPLTTLCAYWAGGIGETLQESENTPDRILGVRPYHFVWIIFPLYFYALGLVYAATVFLRFELTAWNSNSLLAGIAFLLILLPAMFWYAPLAMCYFILNGQILSHHSGLVRAIVNFFILLVGAVIAVAIQYGCYWLIEKWFA